MQSDGNLVVYLSTKPLWSSHTGGHTGATLQIANDGRLIIHSTTGVVLWQSGAALPTPTITDQTGHTCSANTYGTLTDFITHAKCVPPLESAADKQFGVFTVERSNHVRAGFFNDGCSGIGKLTQNPYPGYEHVCDIHDYMYLLIAHFGQGNESVYGNLRAQADQIFQKELYSICSTYSGLQSAIGVTCRRTADTYYCTVRGFGNPSDAAAANEGKLSLDPTFVPVGTKCP